MRRDQRDQRDHETQDRAGDGADQEPDIEPHDGVE